MEEFNWIDLRRVGDKCGKASNTEEIGLGLVQALDYGCFVSQTVAPRPDTCHPSCSFLLFITFSCSKTETNRF